MNWTEGTLARHSRRKGWDKDAARQKEYFAKARARRHDRNPNKKPVVASFVPDYIPHNDDAGDRLQSLDPTRDKAVDFDPCLIESCLYENLNIAGEDAPTADQPETLEDKRRRLLEKSDWTGVSFQKPVVVEFSCKANLPQHLASKPKVDGPRGTKRSHVAGHSKSKHHLVGCDAGPEPNDGMRFTIGGQQLRWSTASNSIRGLNVHPGSVPTKEAWKSMQSGKSAPYTPSHSSSSVQFPSQRHPPPSDQGSRAGEPNISLSSDSATLQDASDTSLRCKRPRTSEDPRFIIQSSPLVIYHPQPTHGGRPSVFEFRSPDLNEVESNSTQVGIPNQVPFQITEDDTESNVAQVGIPNQDSSHITEDDVEWMTWLDSPASGIGRLNEPEQEKSLAALRAISPGVSHYWAPFPEPLELCNETSARYKTNMARASSIIVIPSSPSSEEGGVDETPLDAPALDCHEPLWLDDHTGSHDADLGTLDHALDQNLRSGTDLVLPTTTQLPRPPDIQDLIDLLMEEKQSLPCGDSAAEPKDQQRTTEEEEDEVWKRFVFDDDVSEIDRKARIEAQQQTSQQLRLVIGDSPRAEHPSDLAEPPSTCMPLSWSPRPTYDSVHPDESLRSPLVAPTADTADIAAASITAQASSPKLRSSDFKFHHPTLFVGRLASTGSAETQRMAPPQTRKRGRVRRRRGVDRPDIRAMPDFDDDPIEEG